MPRVTERDYRATLRPRFLLVVADPDVNATHALATELTRFHVDTELCDDLADALLAAGMLRPDAVLLGTEQDGPGRPAVVAAVSSDLVVNVGMQGRCGVRNSAVA